jgi:predicted nucleic acid-binding protein
MKASDLLDRHGLGRKRIADTLLAATLLHHGISELITWDPRHRIRWPRSDFSRREQQNRWPFYVLYL